MVNNERLKALLQKYFGFVDFKPQQKAVLDQLFAGNDTLAILPTGSGKTLIYQIYGLISQQPILIVSPLLALMADQIARVQYLGFKKVVAINSLKSFEEQRAILRNLKQYQFVYISPEMLNNSEVISRVKTIKWGLFVVDEAHCISEWGHDFRPNYLSLGRILKQIGHPLTLLLTATATSEVQSDILQVMGLSLDKTAVIRKSVNRSNIFLAVDLENNDVEKNQRLEELVTHLKGAGIIYFSSKKLANQIAEKIRSDCGIRAAAYHSGLVSTDKYKIQHQFMTGDLDVICATSAFGMGIDKSDIRYVIHYHMPIDLESYVQETGRAGRDGKQSIAILLYRPGDENLPLNLILNGIANQDEITFAYQHPGIFKNQNDDKIRLLKYYYEHSYKPSIVINELQLTLQKRRQNLKKLVKYIKTNQCRRNLILNYFDDSLVEHDDKCCNGLNTKTSISDLSLYVKNHSRRKESNDWQYKLRHLFNL